MTTPAEPAVGNLLADMNHEIRTSMNGIVGMLELLLDTELTASQQQFATIAQSSVENLLELIEDIVDLSMIESRQLALAHTPFDLLQEMRAACALERAAACDNGLDLVVQYPPSLMLNGDPARVRRVIASLIESAIGLARGGQIVVAAQVEDDPARCCRLRVTVTATDLKIPGEQLAAILELPIRSSVAALRPHGKTGLELALCRELAKMMGGRIGVDSLPQQRTEFWLTLELPPAASQLAGARVLLADNADAERSALEAQLAAHGLHVDAVGDAAAALAAIAQAAAAQTPYRIVILGSGLRGMDAGILGSALAGDPRYRDIALVLLGASGDDAHRLADAGFSAMLARPVQAEALLALLNRLDRDGVTRDAAPSQNTMPQQEQNMLFAGRRILVADDNPVNQQIAARMLEKLGCITEVAGNGREAVDMHRTATYELILMDCQMPELDGYQATERIRAMEGAAVRTPVVALTACTTRDEQEKCTASGMDGFISKPIRPQALKDALGRWLRLRTDPAQAPATTRGDELEAVRDMFGTDFTDLARLYQADSPPRIALLRDAHAAGDSARVAKIAHAFSGSSASIGASGLSALCRDLEIQTRAGSLDDFAMKMTMIEAEYGRVSSKLQSMIGFED